MSFSIRPYGIKQANTEKPITYLRDSGYKQSGNTQLQNNSSENVTSGNFTNSVFTSGISLEMPTIKYTIPRVSTKNLVYDSESIVFDAETKKWKLVSI